MRIAAPTLSLLAWMALGCTTPDGPAEATTTPVPSTENRAAAAGWLGGGAWIDQHEDICAIGRERPVDLVFLGDSITQSFGGAGRNVGAPGGSAWKQHFADRNAANFGISGDRTQHVLWRIQNGAFDAVDPSWVVLMIGTNNVGHDEPDAIVDGIQAIVAELLDRLPKTRVLLLGIFPRGASPDDSGRIAVRAVNAELATWAQTSPNERLEFHDLASTFVADDGALRKGLMAGDSLHLSGAGYEAWAQALMPRLNR